MKRRALVEQMTDYMNYHRPHLTDEAVDFNSLEDGYSQFDFQNDLLQNLVVQTTSKVNALSKSDGA